MAYQGAPVAAVAVGNVEVGTEVHVATSIVHGRHLDDKRQPGVVRRDGWVDDVRVVFQVNDDLFGRPEALNQAARGGEQKTILANVDRLPGLRAGAAGLGASR